MYINIPYICSIKQTNMTDKLTETNHISSSKKIETEQPVVAQKPMSIEAYTKALRAEAEVAKLRATIAKSMFEETMAMVQLNQLKAGQFGPQKAPQNQPEIDEINPPAEDPSETTEID
jgi:hypothetical protein